MERDRERKEGAKRGKEGRKAEIAVYNLAYIALRM